MTGYPDPPTGMAHYRVSIVKYPSNRYGFVGSLPEPLTGKVGRMGHGADGNRGETNMSRAQYEADEATFSAEGYRVEGWSKGIAWSVLGWETTPDEDTEWSGYETRTGKIAVCMIGDDRIFYVESNAVTPLQREEFCGECGQVGCSHDGLERA